MDVISDIAAVGALIGIIKQTIVFIKDVQNASDDRTKIVYELQSSSDILERIAREVKDDPESVPNLASSLRHNGLLTQYKGIICSLVPKLTTARGGLKDMAQRCKFVADKKNIRDTLSTLERHRNMFTLFLGLDEIDMLQTINHKLDSITSRPEAQAYRQAKPMVPFPLDSRAFVGRKEIMTALTHGFTESGRMALYGLGGVGKSQIATEYLCRLHQMQRDVAIFWVSTADRFRFSKSYESIALEIPESFRKDHSLLVMEQASSRDPLSRPSTLMLVKDWLSGVHSGKWLLILDNADDSEAFRGSTDQDDGKSLLRYLPQTSNGQILITSRNQGVALGLVGSQECLIHVDSMSPSEAVSLLRSGLPKDRSTDEDAFDLVAALDCLPLAIKQAVGYINATKGSIGRYLKLFLNNDTHQRRLLEKTYRDFRRDIVDDLQDSVVLTWQMSFDKIRSQRPVAANLLSLMGVFNRDDIPAQLINISVDEIEFDEDIGILLQYSLISSNDDRSLFNMHRLVHFTIRIWLSEQNMLSKWEAEALAIISHAFAEALVKDEDSRALIDCGKLYLHAKAVAGYTFETESHIDLQEKLKREMIHFNKLPPAWLGSKSSNESLASMVYLTAEGTLDWVLESQVFQRWYRTPHGILWLTGSPGEGKSILCSFVIDSLKKRHQQQLQHNDFPSTTLTLSYAFHYRNGPQDQVREMFDEFFRQIHDGDREIPETVRLLYVEVEKEAAPQPPTIEVLSHTLCRVATALETTMYIVIDALDECYPENREIMLLALKQLVKGDSADLRIFASSRPFDDLEAYMIDLKPERMQLEMDNGDINVGRFIRSLVERLHERIRGDSKGETSVERHRKGPLEETMPQEWKEKLIKSLVVNNSGNFLWKKLVLMVVETEMSKCDSPDQIQAVLEILPCSFHDLYARFTSKILSENYHPAKQIFQWLLYSMRPLSLTELVEAAKLNPEAGLYQSSIQQQVSYLYRICGPLLSIQEENHDRYVYLIHSTCREYLFYESWSISDLIPSTAEAQLNIVNRSLECLLANNKSTISEQDLKTSPLLQYSAQYWSVHLGICTTEIPDSIISNLNKLFDPRAPQCFLNWLRIFDPAHPETGTSFDAILDDFGDQAFYVSLLKVPLDSVTSTNTLCLRQK